MEPILVDGSNVARAKRLGARRGVANLAALEALVDGLQGAGWAPYVIVDASLRHRLDDDGQVRLEALLESGDWFQVAKGESADWHLVDEAERLGCAIISNDRMRDHIQHAPWLPARLVPFDADTGALHWPTPALGGASVA